MSPQDLDAPRVWLVGAGPGCADLLTLRAARLLAQSDIVFHDALVQDGILALAPQAELVAVGKRCGRHSTAQRFINKRLVDAARSHRCVVRLKGGDPMLFGRAQEEIDALQAAGIAVEVVPGVTAALASSAALGVSLTRRGTSRNVVFATPRVGEDQQPGDWAASVMAADTAVIYMGAGEAAAITRALLARGRSPSTPVALVESASLPDQQLAAGHLSDLPEIVRRLGMGPATILLGEVFAQTAARAARTELGQASASA
jgi:uroporphyrin-III C-methyltransferase